MPKPQLRTRSKRRVRVTLPGGRETIHYRRGKPSKPSCSKCGHPLPGAFSSSENRKLNRSKRRIWRLYGGQVCHKCLQNALKKAARAI